jgi:ankyrin repeat protein
LSYCIDFFFTLLCVQVLLAMNANVEDRGIKGDCTPLMEAAAGGYVDIVRLLLLHGADVNAQSSAGEFEMLTLPSMAHFHDYGPLS